MEYIPRVAATISPLSVPRQEITIQTLRKVPPTLPKMLVNAVVAPDELLDKALEMANAIATKAQLAVRYSKEAINRGIETDIETGIDIETSLFGMCFATADQKEGMEAFLQKRKPEFKGN